MPSVSGAFRGIPDMKPIRVLYVSGSLGLGHVTRDLAIANQFRALLPAADVEWLAGHPATQVLQEAGERVVAGAEDYGDANTVAEAAARGSGLNLVRFMARTQDAWKQNSQCFLRIVASTRYDLVIGDESYEVTLALRDQPQAKTFRYAFIVDFAGIQPMTRSPAERLGVWVLNRLWSSDYRSKRRPPYDVGLFVGEPDDVPDTRFGLGLPNRRVFAQAMYTFVGYVFPFDVGEYADRAGLRRRLGYGTEPLVICSIGGTAIGRELLELCGRAVVVARRTRPDLRAILVTGPRLSPDALALPPQVEVRAFVPRLYEHFAACDLAVVQGGGTSTAELTALRTPFIYFPLEGHSEQADIARALARRGAGFRMTLRQTTPEDLAGQILNAIGAPVSYSPIRADGARTAARILAALVS
jgi:predicted glycosyltransferase